MSRKRHNKQELVQSSFLPKCLVSIIIPVHRRIDLLQECVASLPGAFGEIPYEIILLDNATPKDEKEIYAEWKQSPYMRIYEFITNPGFPKTCNVGAKKAISPLLFFLNSDVVLQPDSGKTLVKAMDDPNVGVCGMKLLFPEHTDLNPQIRPGGKVQHVGLATNVYTEFYHIFCGWSPENPRVNAMRDVYAVTGAALMTRRKLFQQAGGFFEGYGKGTWEDVDYCLTLEEMGYNIIVETKAIGIHYTGATAEKYQIPYPFNLNRLIFMQRHGEHLQYTEWRHL